MIWIYTVCKGRVYPGSAGLGLKIACRKPLQTMIESHILQNLTWDYSIYKDPALGDKASMYVAHCYFFYKTVVFQTGR